MSDQHTKNWPDLAIGLFEQLTGRGAEISYSFDKMHLHIPSGTGDNAEHAEWILDGTIKVTTEEKNASPK